MTKIRDYYLWDEDNYDPFAPEGSTLTKKKKNDDKKVYERYEEEDDF